VFVFGQLLSVIDTGGGKQLINRSQDDWMGDRF
jgi:hypothetical protein